MTGDAGLRIGVLGPLLVIRDGVAIGLPRGRTGVLLAVLEMSAGRPMSVGRLAGLRELAARHPLREPLWGQLIRALTGAGRQAEAIGEYHRAREILAVQDALRLAREAGQPNDEASALRGLGEVHLRAGQFPGGVAYLRKALEIYRRLGMPAADQVTARLAEIGAC